MKKRNYKIMSFVLAGIVAIAAAIGLLMNTKLSDQDIAVEINGESVTVAEFRARLNYAHRANTFSYFKNKYGADADADFWNNRYGDEIPINFVREKTLKDIIRLKVQQILMKEHGILGDSSYESFQESLRVENQSRNEAVKKGQVIYGPIEYGEGQYFDYLFSNQAIKLKEKMYYEKNSISEDELRGKYETDKVELYSLPDYIKVEKIVIRFDLNGAGREAALQKITEANMELDSGISFEEVGKQFNDDGKAIEQIFDENSLRHDLRLNPELKTVAEIMELGQVSDIIESDAEFDIIKCVERKNNRFQSYEDAKHSVQKAYIDEKYEELVDKLVKEANVQINKKVFEKIYP